MIRTAALADVPAILALGRAFFDQAGWPRFADWHEESTTRFLRSIIGGEIEGGLIVAEAHGAVVGMTGYLCFPAYFNFAAKFAQEIFWYVAPPHRLGAALHARLESDARARGVTVIIMSAVSGLRDAALARSYRMRGYSAGESTFMKRL